METFQSDMCSEFKRYATFNGFQTPPGVWPLQLAQAGFFRSGTCQEFHVICFACGLPLDVRNVKRESVIGIHRRLAPTCSFVSGSANNQAVPEVDTGAALEWLNQNFAFGAFQQDGNETMFQSHSLPLIPDSVVDNSEDEPRSLPSIPVMFPERGDTLPSLPILSNINTLEQPGLSSLPSGLLNSLQNATLDSPLTASLFDSSIGGPGDILVVDSESDGIEGNYEAPLMAESEIPSYTPPTEAGELGEILAPKKLTFDDLGIIIQRPKRQDLATYPKRLNTFEKWLGPQISQTKESITEAGFYYAGYSDCCRCFYCGGGLKNWEPDDDPWVEHARWFKDCPYLLTSKGKGFVEAVQSLARTSTGQTIRMSDVEAEMAYTACQTGLQNVSDDVTDDQTLDEMDTQMPESEVERLQSENDSLKLPNTCKICMDEEISVLYVPCGHLVTCGTCAPTVQSCPICRQTIRGQIRVQRFD